MNGFRITILTLLCLALGLMFYAVLVLVPSWQGEYNAYQADKRLSQYDRKSDIHRQQMVTYDPSFEAPEVQKARLAAEEAALINEKAVIEAEENNVIAAAIRQEETERARAEQEAAAAAAAEARNPTLGTVLGFEREWQSVRINPREAALASFQRGAVLAVFRNAALLCEITVEHRDAESGQVIATVRVSQGMPGMNEDGSLPMDREPQPGDVVAASLFQSADDLRASSGFGGSADPFLQGTPQPGDGEVPPLRTGLPDIAEPDSTNAAADDASGLPSLPEETEDEAPLPAAGAAEPSEEVRRALDVIPSTAPSKLPTLDSMLQPTLY